MVNYRSCFRYHLVLILSRPETQKGINQSPIIVPRRECSSLVRQFIASLQCERKGRPKAPPPPQLTPGIISPSNGITYDLPFLLPAFPRPPSSFRLCQSSISRRTPSRYDLYSSLVSTSSSGQWPERRRCRFRFSQRQSGLKVQLGCGHLYGRRVCKHR